MMVLRRQTPGSIVHWAWIAPIQRRTGMIMVIGDVLFESRSV